MKEETLYLKCKSGDVGELVLLTGSPERVERIAGFLENVEKIAHNREFYTVTGEYGGQRLSAVSSGIGASSAAIAIEELVHLEVKVIVRVGTTMGISVPMGSCIIATGAARFEGTSKYYLDPAYPAVPDWTLAQTLLSSGKDHELDMRLGITATYDAFYPSMAAGLAGYDLENAAELEQAQIVAVDMETALLYIMGTRLRFAAASICLVTNSFAPFAMLDAEARSVGEDLLIKTVLDGLTKMRAGSNQ